MEVMKIVVLGVSAAILAVAVRGLRPEIAIVLSLAACVLLIILAIGPMAQLIAFVEGMADRYGLNTTYIGIAVKMAGLACLCDLGVQICKDAGESAIGAKVELGGKLLIVALALPVIQELLQAVAGLLI